MIDLRYFKICFFDYQPLNMQITHLTKVDILLNGDQVDALSSLIHRTTPTTLKKMSN